MPELWKMTSSELLEKIEANRGYQKGVFRKLGNLPEKPCHSQLVYLYQACLRYDARHKRAKVA